MFSFDFKYFENYFFRSPFLHKISTYPWASSHFVLSLSFPWFWCLVNFHLSFLLLLKYLEELFVTQNRHKSYANNKRRALEFQFRDHVFLGVTLRRHVIRFGKKWELDPQYINLLEILQRVGEVAYKVTLPPQP